MNVPDWLRNLTDANDPAIRDRNEKIFFGLGIGLQIGSLIWTAIASQKQKSILEDHNSRVEAAKAPKLAEWTNTDGVTEMVPVERTSKEIGKALTKEYGKTVLKMAANYIGPVLMTAGSITCYSISRGMQHAEISALTTTCAGLERYISEYEKRNKELNGEESHLMCKYGYKEVEEETVDPETGEVKKTTKRVPLTPEEYQEFKEANNDKVYHDQLFWFSKETSVLYRGELAADFRTLDLVERTLNDRLKINGWVVVNDALDLLSMERTDEGRVEGWVLDEGPMISLGHRDATSMPFLQMGVGNQPILLEMNVHGNVNWLREHKSKQIMEENRKNGNTMLPID